MNLVTPISQAVGQFILNTAPGIPYAGVAIGDAADSSLLSSIHHDRTGADQLFGNVVSPHLGANVNFTA